MKTLVKLFILFVIVVGIAVAGVTYYLDSIAKKAVELGGTKALGVQTSVDNLHLSLLDGSSSLNGFTIANPQGFSQKNFMTLKQAEVAIDINSLLSETIRIPKIIISGLQVSVEQSDQSSNVKALLKNIPKSQSKPATTTTATSDNSSASSGISKKFVVDQIVLEGIGVSAQLAALGTQLSNVDLTVPRIELHQVGQKQGGMSMAELIQYLVEEVLNATANSSSSLSPALAKMLQGDLASADALKAGAIEAASGEVEKATQKLIKDLDLPEGSDGELQQAADSLLKGLLDNK